MFKVLPKFFLKKVSCFPLSATCHGSYRDAGAALEYLDFLDENEPLDGAGVISDDDGSAISLSSDVGLEISRTEHESLAHYTLYCDLYGFSSYYQDF